MRSTFVWILLGVSIGSVAHADEPACRADAELQLGAFASQRSPDFGVAMNAREGIVVVATDRTHLSVVPFTSAGALGESVSIEMPSTDDVLAPLTVGARFVLRTRSVCGQYFHKCMHFRVVDAQGHASAAAYTEDVVEWTGDAMGVAGDRIVMLRTPIYADPTVVRLRVGADGTITRDGEPLEVSSNVIDVGHIMSARPWVASDGTRMVGLLVALETNEVFLVNERGVTRATGLLRVARRISAVTLLEGELVVLVGGARGLTEALRVGDTTTSVDLGSLRAQIRMLSPSRSLANGRVRIGSLLGGMPLELDAHATGIALTGNHDHAALVTVRTAREGTDVRLRLVRCD